MTPEGADANVKHTPTHTHPPTHTHTHTQGAQPRERWASTGNSFTAFLLTQASKVRAESEGMYTYECVSALFGACRSSICSSHHAELLQYFGNNAGMILVNCSQRHLRGNGFTHVDSIPDLKVWGFLLNFSYMVMIFKSTHVTFVGICKVET